MRNFDKHEFDEIFREGLTAPAINEVDEDWILMKARLQNSQGRNKIGYYMIFVSSVAAVLLLVFSLVFNTNETLLGQEELVVKTESQVTPPVQATIINKNNTGSIPASSDYTAFNAVDERPENIYYSSLPLQEKTEGPVQDIVNADLISKNTSNLSDTSSAGALPGVLVQPSNIESTLLSANVLAAEKLLTLEDVDNKEQDDLKSNPSKSRFSLGINFAPDLNGVEQFQSNIVSYSIGAGLIYNISNKFSIEAGAAYGKKTYQTGFSSFRPAGDILFQVKPNIVSSGFDVIDIQFNLAYTLLNKGKSSIGFGAGISSYLMLNEQYSFTYQNANARGVSSFRTGYQNNHFFGIANLNLSYKRSLTNNVKLAINPYLKLPLTDLGYGNIRLKSAGISIGVITNLNKNKK